jgi:hypothetical protein
MKFNRLASAVILYTASLPILAASYTVTELATDTLGPIQYGVSIDNTGLILTAVENIYNAPVDLNTIDFENATIIANLTDIESARNGVFNLADYTYLINIARSGSSTFSYFTQQLGRLQGYKTDGSVNSADFINAFDTENAELNGFSHSMNTTPRDSAGGTHIVGNSVGPFRTIDYVADSGTESKYILSDFDRRAFVQVGQNVVPLLPTDTTLGGISQVNSINANYLAAGSGSVAPSATTTTGIENCGVDETRGDQPIEACYRTILIFGQGTSTASRRTGVWSQRATLWSLDVEGNVVDTTTFDTLVTDEEELAAQGSSQALDVNNNGVAVGVSSVKVDVREQTVLTTAASLFLQSGEVVRILEDDDLLPNSAISINDSGYVVGLRSQSINRVSRNKMFIYNMNDDTVNFPDDFFTSSSTIPRALNNNNLVVGSADIEATNTSIRKTAAFLYDIEADTFTDLNTLISCSSPFDLIEATDINDNNEIVVSALTKRPSKNARGELLLDDSGESILVDTVVTLKLNPTGQAPAVCTDEELGVIERQGGSTGVILFTVLAFTTYFRRWLMK